MITDIDKSDKTQRIVITSLTNHTFTIILEQSDNDQYHASVRISKENSSSDDILVPVFSKTKSINDNFRTAIRIILRYLSEASNNENGEDLINNIINENKTTLLTIPSQNKILQDFSISEEST